MNKSLLKILVATVAVGATVATTLFAVRKLKKNKTKTEEEIKEETEEEVKDSDEREIKPDSEDSKKPDDSDDTSDIEMKIKQCMEKPLTKDEIRENVYCFDDMSKQKTEEYKELEKEYIYDPLAKEKKNWKNKYNYMIENHFKNLSNVTCDFIKSLTKEERKYEDLILAYLRRFKDFETCILDESDLYTDTFKRLSDIYRDKIQETIDKTNSEDKEIKMNLINKYNKFLFDDLFMNEHRFEVICKLSGLN